MTVTKLGEQNCSTTSAAARRVCGKRKYVARSARVCRRQSATSLFRQDWKGEFATACVRVANRSLARRT